MIFTRPDFIDSQTIKRCVDPFDFYAREQELVRIKKSGKWMEGGKCPFHNDRKSGSFYVNLQNGSYRCHSCGAKGGDIIAFTMAKYGLPFRGALEKLSKEWRVV